MSNIRILPLVLKPACIGGAALLVLISNYCSCALAQKYAEQSGNKSYSKSYASTKSQYKGNSYAQSGQGHGSSYASSAGAVGGTSYAQSSQAQTSSYASSAANGSSYARGSSSANSTKAIPYSQQIKFGNSSGGSLLGIMRGAPAARTQFSNSQYNRPKSASAGRAPVANNKTAPPVSTTKPTAGPKWSKFNKLRPM